MRKFRWTHKKPAKRRHNSVVDCVREAERINARMQTLQTEITRLGSLPPEEAVSIAEGLLRRMQRLRIHMAQVADIQLDWAEK